MEKIKSLGRYQKTILLFITGMILVFTLLYSVTMKRVGFAYQNTILIPSQENGITTYSGKIKGKSAIFTISEYKTVHFEYDNKLYGPYTAKEDATAVPKDHVISEALTGIVLYCKDAVIFRGGVCKTGDSYWLVHEDGNSSNIQDYPELLVGTTSTNEYTETIADEMEPSISTILDLMDNPKLTHKGDLTLWFYGVVFCFINTISILFTDELFRFNLAFQIRDADHAEPSDWEIASRYIGWTVLTILALITFIVGLTTI